MTAPPSKQPFFTITRDNADSSYRMDLIGATSAEEAERLAVEARNVENDYGPKDDGGFESITALDQDDLRQLLVKMQARGGDVPNSR